MREMLTFETGAGQFNVRVVAVVIDGERVLVQGTEEDSYWILPGGRAELNESAIDGIRREMAEELGVEVEVERLLWIVDNFFTTEGVQFHQIAFYFLAHLPAPCALVGIDGEWEGFEEAGNFHIKFKWCQIDEVAALPILPVFLSEGLLALPASTEYLVVREGGA